jgi:SAM-dependent methyltransferase
MLDYLAAQAFRANAAAFNLGVYAALSERPYTAPELAHRLHVDERGLTLLLDALEALGYVKKTSPTIYALAPAIGKWLPTFSAHSVKFFERVVFDWWGHLGDSIRRGRSAMPPMDHAAVQDLQAGMIALARMAGHEIAARVRPPAGAARLVDLGGGHGLYSIRFCQRYPDLSATIVDEAGPLETARTMIEAEHVTGRVSLREGNLLTDDIGGGYDMALLFNVVHYHLPDTNKELLAKVARALNPNGLLVVMDQMPGRVFGPTVKALFRLQALHMLNAVSGQTYTADEISRWMKDVGFTRPRRYELRTAMGHTVVTATKPRRFSDRQSARPWSWVLRTWSGRTEHDGPRTENAATPQ